MSRIYFHSLSGTTEVRGSERAWMGNLIDEIGSAPVTPYALHDIDEWAEVDVYGRRAKDLSTIELQQYMGQILRPFGFGRSPISLDGRSVDIWRLSLNTAWIIGGRPVRLAARLHAQCEIHCWVDGPDRAWLADGIDEAVACGLFRESADYDSGWSATAAMLRRRDDEPVVTSYSVCEQFPGAYTSDWMAEFADVEYSSLSAEQKTAQDERQDAWHDLAHEEQWERGMKWLRAQPGELQLLPKDFEMTTGFFGDRLTWFDFLGIDAAERVRARRNEAA